MTDRRESLLFLVTDHQCPEKVPVISTLGWLARRRRIAFDAHVGLKPSMWRNWLVGLPLTGMFVPHWAHEQFYFTTNYYETAFCSLSSTPAVRLLNSMKAFGKTIVTTKRSGELVEFYKEVFAHFKEPLPTEAVMINTSVNHLSKGELEIDPYCYPEVFYREALGVPSNLGEAQLSALSQSGVKTVRTVYVKRPQVAQLGTLGFDVDVVDQLKDEDTYGSVTSRIADRWITRARGLGFGDQNIMLSLLPRYMDEDRVALFEPFRTLEFARTISEYLGKIENPVFPPLRGMQTAVAADDLLTELSKYGILMELRYNCSPAITVKDKIPYSFTWLDEVESIWSKKNELSDEELARQATSGGIAVSFVGFSSDMGHIIGLPRMIELAQLSPTKIGISLLASWFVYWPELIEEFYIPWEVGGVYPLIEPMIVSSGWAAATEADGYFPRDRLISYMKAARNTLSNLIGDKHVPIGHYPWQDACPYYKHNTAEPRFGAIKEAGFEYSISYKHEGKDPEILYMDDKFIAINQQVTHWTQQPLEEIRRVEMRLGKPGWIVVGLDSPFWFSSPFYWDPAHIALGTTLSKLKTAVDYAKTGGLLHKLFLTKPHETARYARILRREGYL